MLHAGGQSTEARGTERTGENGPEKDRFKITGPNWTMKRTGDFAELLYFVGVPKYREFELSPELLAKADALTREIASINNSLGLRGNSPSSERFTAPTRTAVLQLGRKDAAGIPHTVFKPSTTRCSDCTLCTSKRDEVCPVQEL